jgi:ferritin-like metal-binding protein YciE
MNVQERLIHYLDDAWAVEKALADMMKDMAGEVADPAVKAEFEEDSRSAKAHEEALEARIRALGKEPQKLKGLTNRIIVKLADLIQSAHDEHDKAAQHLMEAYAAEHLEMAMYRSLEAFADAIGDQETAELARQHFQHERASAEKVWAMLPAVAADAANSAEPARR